MKLIPNVDPIPYLRIENFFSEVELTQLVFPELDYYTRTGKLLNALETGSARDQSGDVIKNNHGVFIEQLYRENSASSIAGLINNLWNTNTCAAIEQTGPWNRGFRQSNANATLVNYYQDGDYYMPHVDDVQFTLLIWLWKEPKAWSGGNFYFNDVNHKIKMVNNSAVLFPGCYTHSVDKVNMNNPSHLDGTGRYCLSRFYWIHQATDMFSYSGTQPRDMTPFNLSDSLPSL